MCVAMKRMCIAAVALLLVACSSDSKPSASSLSPSSASTGFTVNVRDGIVYGRAAVGAPTAGDTDLLLDLYDPSPPSSGARAVVVLVHGGGFTMQSRKDDGIVKIARGLAAEGIVVATIDYRLAGQSPAPSARVGPLVAALPAVPASIATTMATAVEDTLTAIDYLRANAADLDIDVDRLGLIGSSAGAITVDHLAYVLDEHGIEAPKIRFVASLWGTMFVEGPGGGPTMGQVNPGEPALFAVHGDADTTVSVQGEDDLVAHAKAAGIETEYHRIAGAGHGFVGSQFFAAKVDGNQTSFDRLLAFAAAKLS